MNELTDWLRRLITIIIIMGFIEMLTPENGLKKTVKLVIGLMVMVVLLQPLTRLFKIPFNSDRIAHWGQIQQPAAEEVLKRGLQMRERWQTSFNSQQRALVEEKIASVIGLIDEIELREVRFSDSTPGLSGVIVKVVPAVKGELSKTFKDKLNMKIEQSVRLACDFSKEQIEVIWDETS